MAFLLDPLAQWVMRRFFIKYQQKRRQQLAGLGRKPGVEPPLSAVGALRFDGVTGPELRFSSAADGGRVAVSVAVIEEGIVRIAATIRGRPRLERTWAVCGRPGEVPLEGRRRDDWSAFACPRFTHEALSDRVSVRTKELAFDVGLSPFGISWRSAPDGALIAEDAREGALSFEPPRPDGLPGRALRHSMAKTRRRFYGFGEKSGLLNKNGRRLIMMGVDSMGYDARLHDPLYKHFPCYLTLDDEGKRAWGLFYDNFAVSEFDLGSANPWRVTWTADAGEADWYFVNGPSVAEVVRRFALLSGKPVLPPRWSLGYGGSTMGYTEAPDAQTRLERFLALCEEKGFPCDLFHLSSGYTTGSDGKRYVFEWNQGRIPDPEELFKRYAEHDVHVAANVKPALLTTHPRYPEVDAMGGFVRGPDGRSFVAPFWGGVGSWLDFTNPRTRAWWMTRMRESLLARGVDSSWNDNNEFEAWDEGCTCERFGERGSIDQMRPLLTYHMVRASTEAQREHAPGNRPFVLTRAACPGVQRYAQTWTGDNYASWAGMRWNLPMGLGLSLSGMPNFGHDAGGFAGFRIGSELFARWVQVAALHPRFCIHSWHFDGTVNEPWMYPRAMPAIRAAFELRYKLLPYLYSLFALSAATGDPILRPLVYHFAHDPVAAEESFDFMLGPFLLAAPVCRRGARQRRLHLPRNSEWFDFSTGVRLAAGPNGGSTVLAAPLDHIPLLAAAGSILPMGAALARANAHPDVVREIRLFPATAGGMSEFTLYEDDGHSVAYVAGEKLEINVALSSTKSAVDLKINCKGPWRPEYDRIELVIPPGEERPLSYRGTRVVFGVDTDSWRRAEVPFFGHE